MKKYIRESHDKVLADPEITDFFKLPKIMLSLIDIHATNITIDQALQDPEKGLVYLQQTRAAIKIIMSYDQTRLDVVNERIRLILEAEEPRHEDGPGGTQEPPGKENAEVPGQEAQDPEKR